MSETLETVLRASVRTLAAGGRDVTLPDAPARQADGFTDSPLQGRDQRERRWRSWVAHIFDTRRVSAPSSIRARSTNAPPVLHRPELGGQEVPVATGLATLSAWESVRYGLTCRLTCGAGWP